MLEKGMNVMLYQWRKIQIRGQEAAEITGLTENVSAETAIERLVIPEEIEGLLVCSIGKHAFASRKNLKEVFLPEHITTLGGFAFHNCPNLTVIHLSDSVVDYYDGVIRQCEELRLIEITCRQSSYTIVRAMLADSDRELSFHLHLQDGGEVLLTFPAFVYDFVENTMARTIQFAIDGSGYRYRECVSDERIDYREYDSLFEKAVSDDRKAAAAVALGRLRFPYSLEEQGRKRYEGYLREHAEEILPELIRQDQTADVEFLSQQKLLDQNTLRDGIRLASEGRKTELCAVLMNYQKELSADTAQAETFTLGDL